MCLYLNYEFNCVISKDKIDIFSDGWLFAKKKIQFNHPNYSGLQFNQLTRTEIPADYIDTVVITTKYG